MKKIFGSGWAWLWIAIVVIIFDRYTKFMVLQHLTYQEPWRIFPFLNLTLAYNTGAAFSFLHSATGWQNWFLGGMALVVSVIVLVWLLGLPRRSIWMGIALNLVLGGALGNMWDRIQYGYVIDFLSFHLGDWYFAIFNIADSAICVGAVMMMLYWIWEKK